MLTFGLLAAAALGWCALVVGVLSTRSVGTRFCVAAVAVVLQGYPTAALPQSISLALTYVLLAGLLLVVRRELQPAGLAPKVLLGLICWSVVALVWSPDVVAGAVSIARLLTFVILTHYAVRLARQEPGQLERAVDWLAPVMLVQAAAVLVFARRPDVETTYLTTGSADLLIGHQAVRGLFTTSPDNVLDPVRAAGLLFLNSNTASMFLGVAACCYLAVGSWTGHRRHHVVAAALLLAVLGTGSKTGVALALLVPVAYVLASAMRRWGRAGAVALLAGAAPVGVLLYARLPVWAPQYSRDSLATLRARSYVWDAAGELFAAHPVLGLGFGGWGDRIALFAGPSLPARYPPHNSLILAWSETGLVGMALVVLFVAAVSVMFLEAAGRCDRLADARVLTLGWAAFTWAFMHSMGDATSFFGDVRNLPFLAVALGLLTALREPSRSSQTVGAYGRPAG